MITVRKKEQDKLRFFHPMAGTNRIRVLPNPSNTGKFWKEIRVHWAGDNNHPVKFTACVSPCPLCVEYEKSHAKEIRPVNKVLFNVFDYRDNKIKIWSTTEHLFGDLVDALPFEELDKLTHPTRGRDLEIVRQNVDPLIRLKVRALSPSKVKYDEKELYHLNKVANKMFMVKRAKPRKMLRMLVMDASWK